ncbi:MAG: hypothetical protein ABUS54_09685, partial [Actinomycetota bacterium]
MLAFQTYIRRVLSHSGIYAIGSVSGIFTGLLGLVILTRLLSPAEYGRLSVLIAFASMLTLLYSLGTYQGTNRAGFGTSDSDLIFRGVPPEEAR